MEKKSNNRIKILLFVLVLSILILLIRQLIVSTNKKNSPESTQHHPCYDAISHGECLEMGCKALHMSAGMDGPWCVP